MRRRSAVQQRPTPRSVSRAAFAVTALLRDDVLWIVNAGLTLFSYCIFASHKARGVQSCIMEQESQGSVS